MRKITLPAVSDPERSVDLFDVDRLNEFDKPFCVATAILIEQVEDHWNKYVQAEEQQVLTPVRNLEEILNNWKKVIEGPAQEGAEAGFQKGLNKAWEDIMRDAEWDGIKLPGKNCVCTFSKIKIDPCKQIVCLTCNGIISKDKLLKIWKYMMDAGDQVVPFKPQYVRGGEIYTCPICGYTNSSHRYLNIGYFQIACEEHIKECYKNATGADLV
ncbi:MAG: hypothetical protein PHZ02_01245 [Desulfocapsaceae bacterium]|nr:hypothetical protein [Desulfocapsaceae bacterium]